MLLGFRTPRNLLQISERVIGCDGKRAELLAGGWWHRCPLAAPAVVRTPRIPPSPRRLPRGAAGGIAAGFLGADIWWAEGQLQPPQPPEGAEGGRGADAPDGDVELLLRLRLVDQRQGDGDGEGNVDAPQPPTLLVRVRAAPSLVRSLTSLRPARA